MINAAVDTDRLSALEFHCFVSVRHLSNVLLGNGCARIGCVFIRRIAEVLVKLFLDTPVHPTLDDLQQTSVWSLSRGPVQLTVIWILTLDVQFELGGGLSIAQCRIPDEDETKDQPYPFSFWTPECQASAGPGGEQAEFQSSPA